MLTAGIAMLLASIGWAPARAAGINVGGLNCSTTCIGISCTNTCTDGSEAITGSGKIVTRRFDFREFDSVSVGEVFKVDISQGKEYLVEVSVDDNLVEYVKVEKNGDELSIGIKDGIYNKISLSARIVIPKLASLKTRGTAKASFHGFEQDRMTLRASGVSRIQGDHSQIAKAMLHGDGNIAIDLTEVQISQGKLAIAGVSKVHLNFGAAEGALSGGIEGVTTVAYCGRLQSNQVSVSGVSQITRLGTCP
jgi:hypothetical protein